MLPQYNSVIYSQNRVQQSSEHLQNKTETKTFDLYQARKDLQLGEQDWDEFQNLLPTDLKCYDPGNC